MPMPFSAAAGYAAASRRQLAGDVSQ